MYDEKKKTGTQYSLKSNGTVMLKIPSFVIEKWYQEKVMRKNSPCCWNNTKKRKGYNVSTVWNLENVQGKGTEII